MKLIFPEFENFLPKFLTSAGSQELEELVLDCEAERRVSAEILQMLGTEGAFSYFVDEDDRVEGNVRLLANTSQVLGSRSGSLQSMVTVQGMVTYALRMWGRPSSSVYSSRCRRGPCWERSGLVNQGAVPLGRPSARGLTPMVMARGSCRELKPG